MFTPFRSLFSKLSAPAIVLMALPLFFVALPDGHPFVAYALCPAPYTASGQLSSIYYAAWDCLPTIDVKTTRLVPYPISCGFTFYITLTITNDLCCVTFDTKCGGQVCITGSPVRCGVITDQQISRWIQCGN